MNLIFSFLAGLLTTLSPCVLPVLPFVTASSISRSRLGPIYLCLGLLLSFVGVSLLVSTTGMILGIEPAVIRKTSGLLLMFSGFLFLSQPLSDWLAERLSFLSGNANRLGQAQQHKGFLGEFVGGLLLGIVWTPCSGPSLGAALGLASQEGNFLRSAVVLLVFGLGAVLPLLMFAYGAKQYIGSVKGHLGLIKKIKVVFGILIVIFGFLILFELDRKLEASLTEMLPDVWINFITKF